VALNTTTQTYLWVIRVLIDQGKIPASANKQKKRRGVISLKYLNKL
jgi:hypothetical protein